MMTLILGGIIHVLLLALKFYFWVIILSVIMSWLVAFNVINTRNRFVASLSHALYQMTEPVYRRIRRFLPNTGGIDFSPIIIFLAIAFLEYILVGVLQSL